MDAWDEVAAWYKAHGYKLAATPTAMLEAKRGPWAYKPEGLLTVLRESERLLKRGPVKPMAPAHIKLHRQHLELIDKTARQPIAMYAW